jgi:hypothetical protein
MKKVIVIHEKDFDDDEHIIIGVADSIENAEEIIKKYYGDYKVINNVNTENPNIEYSKILELKGGFGKTYKVKIWLEWFILNTL